MDLGAEIAEQLDTTAPAVPAGLALGAERHPVRRLEHLESNLEEVAEDQIQALNEVQCPT